ncbi:MAG TPA: GMC family oxidoreductase [Saprospiraceae bacterium]|nr:GMC family oxidoreductase [Saprospiraceae bacterium]HMQ85786.1 GMC family oxidoreductase [Saprospiraceae bacterium]
MQLKEPGQVYDAVIVGSGAGGGMTAKILADKGWRIAVIEAGPYFDPADPATKTQMRWPWESPRRGAGTVRPFGDFDMAYGGWDIEGEPYTNAEGSDFRWFRSRMLGGRTNHWGRISLRFGPNDFHRKDIDGLGANWPISYEDVKPYYDKVDKLIGVFGTNEGLPNDPDGFFLPPPKPRLHEWYYIKGAKKSGVTVIPSRLSILTKKLHPDRGVCFYCRQCARSCMAYADFSSGSCLIFPAQKSGGQIDLFVECMAREVVTDSSGKATAVSYVNKKDRREYQLKGKVIILAASACETSRILLNSKSSIHPNGLGNGSGVVGHYLHDSTGSSMSGFIPALMDRDIYNEDGVGGLHVYSPWWGNNKKLDFPRGYHIEVWGGMDMPGYGFGWDHAVVQRAMGMRPGGYGSSLKDEVKRFYGAYVGMSGRGEAVARYENYCEIDPLKVDEWGIPVLRFNYKWSDYEKRQARHMQHTFEEILTNMGATILSEKGTAANDYGLNKPGEIIHEVGTARMGSDPRDSATNAFGKLHEVPNVYITDAATFPSQADKNPTWTIMALAWRTADHLIAEYK